MSRGEATLRRGLRASIREEMVPDYAVLDEEREREAERLEAENSRLQDALKEAEGWYRLLQADHASLQTRHGQVGRKVAQLQAVADRLDLKNRELEIRLDRPAGPSPEQAQSKESRTMNRIKSALRSVSRHRWGSAAVVAIATLIARDPSVQGVVSSATARVRDLVGRSESGESTPSGFVLYAAYCQARNEAEQVRTAYNAQEAGLKGDALLEAQDRIRSSKSRSRQARQAFLPELVRQCRVSGLPVPREAMEELAALNQESK